MADRLPKYLLTRRFCRGQFNHDMDARGRTADGRCLACHLKADNKEALRDVRDRKSRTKKQIAKLAKLAKLSKETT